MSVIDQPEIDFGEIDADYRARVALVGVDWRADDDYARFVDALMACRRGAMDEISTNDVRVRFLEDTVDGPRCSIEHHRYSAFWARAQAEDLIEVYMRDDEVVVERITTSPTGNNGKWIPVRRWLGGTKTPGATSPAPGQTSTRSNA